MIRTCILFAIITYSLNCFSQTDLNLRLNSMFASTADAIYVDDKYAYVMGNTFDTTRLAILVGKFYKIDLEKSRIIDSFEINSNPIEFETRATKLYNIEDTLHYFTYGQERRDSVIDGQNNFTYFHHFKYSLADGVWTNETFPAFNEVGRQFLSNTDAYISDSSIYVANITTDFEINDSDVLLTKLDHFGKVEWNVELENEIFHSVQRILENNNDEVIISGLISDIAADKQSGYRHLFLEKINPNNGTVIKKIVIEEDSDIPKSLIEDPKGGYIIGSGDAVFQEGARFPAITRIIKINEDLDSIVWELPLSDTLSFNPFWHLDNFTSLGNNEFLAVGVADMIEPFSHLGRIIKFTGDGELIFDKEIQHFSPRNDLEQRLTDVAPYKDGFIACGTIFAYTSDFIIPRQHGWVVYIDKDGNTDISSATDFIAVDKGVVKLYPNPTSNSVFLDFEEELLKNHSYEIFTLDGALVQSGIITAGTKRDRIELNVSQLGTYVVRISSSQTTFSKLLHYSQ